MTKQEREGYAEYIARMSSQQLCEEWDEVTTDLLASAHRKKEVRCNRMVIEYPWKRKPEEPPTKKKKTFTVRNKKTKPTLWRKNKQCQRKSTRLQQGRET